MGNFEMVDNSLENLTEIVVDTRQRGRINSRYVYFWDFAFLLS